MSSAVIFAAYFPNPQRAQIYLDALKMYYGDCDIYIGLNSSFIACEQYLNKQGFFNISYVPRNLEVNSDASAFQSGLKLLKSVNKEYDVIHFLHSKGISRQSESEWMINVREYFLEFCKKKSEIEVMIRDNADTGGVGLIGRAEKDIIGYSKELSKYGSFSKDESELIMTLITLYSIRGSIVKKFIDTCHNSFFTTRLDRYFFESIFPLIVDRSGYIRKHFGMW